MEWFREDDLIRPFWPHWSSVQLLSNATAQHPMIEHCLWVLSSSPTSSQSFPGEPFKTRGKLVMSSMNDSCLPPSLASKPSSGAFNSRFTSVLCSFSHSWSGALITLHLHFLFQLLESLSSLPFLLSTVLYLLFPEVCLVNLSLFFKDQVKPHTSSG